MRAAVYALLLSNALYLGWANWIDVPAPLPPSPIASLPHLTLVGELSPQKRAALAKAAVETPAPQCVSVGPFDDAAIAGKAAELLKAKSFAPQQRAAEAQIRRFWVYLDGFASDAAVTRALHRLERGGIDDAEAMPPETGGRRVSLGLFSDQERANHRASLVHAMGFKPATTPRMLPGTVYWLDLKVANGSGPVPVQEVSGLESGGGSTPVGVQPCATAAAPPAVPASAVPVSPAPKTESRVTAVLPSPDLPRCKAAAGGPVPCIAAERRTTDPSVL